MFINVLIDAFKPEINIYRPTTERDEMRRVIDAVIVTYNPDSELLNACVDSLINDIRYIYIIDNSSKNWNNRPFNKKIKFFKLKNNMGVAYAQNIGIKKSLEEKSEFILLSDQDTIYPKDYAKKMLLAFWSIPDNDRIAAIVPLFSDTKQGSTDNGFIQKSLFGVKKFYPKYGLHEVYQAIASGMVLNAKLLNKIGLMRDDFFIDWIDLEWCWRAWKKGYKVVGNADVVIKHQLGDVAVKVGKKIVILRNMQRHYYITRNCVYLALRCSDIDISYKIRLFLYSFKYILGFSIISKDHIKHLKYTSLGFFHGIIGHMGRLDD